MMKQGRVGQRHSKMAKDKKTKQEGFHARQKAKKSQVAMCKRRGGERGREYRRKAESGCACGSSGVSKAEPLTLFLSRCSGAAARFWSDPWEREEGGRPTPCHAPPSHPSPPDPSCVVMSSPLPDDWHTGKQALPLHTQTGVCARVRHSKLSPCTFSLVTVSVDECVCMQACKS